MKKHLKYLKYLIKHRYYVGRECFKHGLYWRGIIHDWSKFLPCEWFSYVESFYGKFEMNDPVYYGPIDYQERYYKTITQQEFDQAWLHHIHNNKHHWQYWVLKEDSGQTKCLEIPRKYVIEMYCDWVGAGLAITGKRDAVGWYEKNKEKIQMHPKSRQQIEELIYNN